MPKTYTITGQRGSEFRGKMLITSDTKPINRATRRAMRSNKPAPKASAKLEGGRRA